MDSCPRIFTRDAAGLDRTSRALRASFSLIKTACKAIWLNDEIIMGLKTIDSCLHEHLTSRGLTRTTRFTSYGFLSEPDLTGQFVARSCGKFIVGDAHGRLDGTFSFRWLDPSDWLNGYFVYDQDNITWLSVSRASIKSSIQKDTLKSNLMFIYF